MNKRRVIIIGALIGLSMPITNLKGLLNPCCEHDRHRSFMFTRPIVQNIALIQAIWHSYIYEKQGPAQASLQVIGVFQESIPTRATNSYFLFNCKSEVTIAGDATLSIQDRDARAEWFNLPSTFSGTFAVHPQQRQWGVLLEYNQNIDNLIKLDFLKGYWIDITVPFLGVRNSVHPTQRIMTPVVTPIAPGAPVDLLTAFDQPDWRYAKFVNSRSKTGIAEIIIRFGKAYMSEHNNQVAYYSGVRVPTSTQQRAEFVFDPVVGNNEHVGFITGVNFQVVTNRNDYEYATCVFLNIENSFFMSNIQRRTFDLLYNPDVDPQNGIPVHTIPARGLSQNPWSRYLLLNKNDGGPSQNIPAVNVLTREVHVHPYGMVDAAFGIRFLYHGWELELGYNIWAHPAEHLELVHCFPAVYGIAGTKDPNNPIFPTTASKSTIDNLAVNDVNFNGDPIFVPIGAHDLDLRSGAAKDTLTHKLYGTINYGLKGHTFDGFLGIGGWWEMPQCNTALQLYGLWLKIGGSF
jgi:hypothetical protein